VERLDLRPFPPAARLPEVETATSPSCPSAAQQVNELRDAIDEAVRFADYALVGEKPQR
jgi:hypothetical protein